jgi:hypothetical protein
LGINFFCSNVTQFVNDIWIICFFTLVDRRWSLRFKVESFAAMALPSVMTKVGMHGARSSLVALPMVRRLCISVWDLGIKFRLKLDPICDPI